MYQVHCTTVVSRACAEVSTKPGFQVHSPLAVGVHATVYRWKRKCSSRRHLVTFSDVSSPVQQQYRSLFFLAEVAKPMIHPSETLIFLW